jgi:hypothetical protein
VLEVSVNKRSTFILKWSSLLYSVFIVKTFARKKTYRKHIRKFRRKYPESTVPTKTCVSKLVKMWQATGSVWHKDALKEDSADWRKVLGYWGMTTDQSSKIITLSTGNRCFARICFHSHKIFKNWSVVVPQYPEPFLQSAESSSIASLCHTLNPWPTTFSQAWIHMSLWELLSQGIYDETYGYIFCKFFPCKSFHNKHTLFNNELQFSTNIDRLLTPLTQTD